MTKKIVVKMLIRFLVPLLSYIWMAALVWAYLPSDGWWRMAAHYTTAIGYLVVFVLSGLWAMEVKEEQRNG